MAAYKDLVGQKITKVTSNPSEPKTGQMWYNSIAGKLRGLGIIEAWSSTSPLTVSRDKPGGLGTQTSALVFGGSPGLTSSDEYDGSSFKSAPALNTGRDGMASGGTTSAGWKAGGNPPATTNATEEYDGSSWTTVPGTLNSGRYIMGSCGTQTAGLCCGGYDGSNKNESEEYNGTTWSEGNNINTIRRTLTTFGIQTAAIATGGQQPPNAASNVSESYDGTSWTSINNNPISVSDLGSAGTQTAGLAFGGYTPSVNQVTTTNKFDGTNFSSAPSMANGTSRSVGVGATQSAAFNAGSTTPSPGLLVEEFNISTNTVTAAAWASGGNINEARRAFGSCGSNTAGLIFGGRLSPTASPPAGYRGQTEQYDGTSWTEVGDLNNTRSNVGGAGTQTTAVAFGGLNPSLGPRPADNVEEWDGSSWTNVTDVPTGSENYGSCGIQTAALQYGGSAPPGVLTTTLEYDGTNWTSGGAMNTGRNLYNGSGTQTAALGAGGQEPSLSSKTEEYDGTSWSEVNNMNRAAFYSSSTSAPQTDSMSFGSGPSVNYVEKYDGTTWSTAPTLGTSRSDGSGFGTSANGSVMVGGPSGPSTYPSATEEFTGETTTGNIADFTTS